MQLSTVPLFRPFGVDFFCLGRKYLVFNMVQRNLRVKYRRSIFGLLWTLLSPVGTAMVYYFVFKVIMNVGIPYYPVFILSGVLFWTFFSQTVLEGMECLTANWGLISKVPIPLQSFPLIGTVTNLVTLVLSFPVLLAAALISGAPIGPSLVFAPFFVLCLFLLAYGLALFVSISFVYFRDLRHILTIAMQMWFYATPVIYSEKMIPEKFRWILLANPVGSIFSSLPRIFIQGTYPEGWQILSAMAWTGFIVLLAAWTMKRFGKDLVENL